MAQLGFISHRNEDGTQWLNDRTPEGYCCWSGYGLRRAFPVETFEAIEATVADSRKNDCPDNGFFGIYNLKFRPCTQEEADAQNAAVDAIEEEAGDTEDDYDHWGDYDADPEEDRIAAQMERYEMFKREY